MTLVMRMIARAAFVPVIVTALSVVAYGEERKLELRLTPTEIWQQSQAKNLRLSVEGKAIELLRGLLIENDGDVAGYSYQPNEEVLSEGLTAFQRLKIAIPRSLSTFPETETPRSPLRAFLLVGHNGKDLHAKINGQAVTLPEPISAGRYWKQFEIPGKVLKDGNNEIGLSGGGKLWIAREDERGHGPRSADLIEPREQQSFKIIKGSPKLEKLGPKDDIAGEYYVRLYLDGYYERGSLQTITFDAADLRGEGCAPPNVRIKRIRAEAQCANGDVNTGIAIAPLSRRREIKRENGRDVILEITEHWDTNKKVELTTEDDGPLPRYFSVTIFVSARDLSLAPQLTSLRIETDIDIDPSWSDKLKIVERHSSETWDHDRGFQFEALDHPRLAVFRKQYNLDDVVKGCTTDLQRMERLAVWTSQQWTKGHLGKIYPKWDALEILKKHEDGTPIGGFCQQYNIVFLQACQSFGMVGRCVSIGSGDHGVNIRSGHEVVEIWSNELNKWVYVDGQAAWYFVDKETRTPLNLLELRERQLAAILDKPLRAESKRAVDVVVLAKSPYEWKGLREWPAFAELRMIPHTQFLDGKLPLPLNQGMRGWFWTGHRVWTDDLYPASVLYSDRVTNPNDWNTPINQTQLWLEQRTQPGELDVRLAHNMPSFEKYLVQIDDQPARESDNGHFTWSLHSGENRVSVRAVNKLGIASPASWVKVEYKP